MSEYKIIMGKPLKVKLAEALNLDSDSVQRIVLDVSVDEPVRAYVTMFGDERLLDVSWDDWLESFLVGEE